MDATAPKYQIGDLVDLPGGGPSGPWRVRGIDTQAGALVYILGHAKNPFSSRTWLVSDQERLTSVQEPS